MAGEINVGAFPEGGAFSPDGAISMSANFIDADLSILKVGGTTLTDTGQRLKLSGHPARCAAPAVELVKNAKRYGDVWTFPRMQGRCCLDGLYPVC